MVTRQFDVFHNPNPRSAREVPYLLCVQHPVLEALPTRVVVPLIRATALAKRPVSRLNPVLVFEGQRLVMLTQQLGAVRASSLTRAAGNVEASRADVIAAIDVLVSGV